MASTYHLLAAQSAAVYGSQQVHAQSGGGDRSRPIAAMASFEETRLWLLAWTSPGEERSSVMREEFMRGRLGVDSCPLGTH